MESLSNFLEKINYKWEKLIGLLLVIVGSLFIYFSFIVDKLKEIIKLDLWIFYFLIPSITSLVIVIYWLINTNRVNWLKRKHITVGIIIKVDEGESEKKIKSLIKETVNDINLEFKDIKLRLYPINYIKSKNSLVDFLKKKGHIVDSIIYAEINSGKEKKLETGEIEDIIEINEIYYCGNFYNGKDLRFLKTSINIANDVKIRNINKNWSYIDSNSKNDKLKIKNNFRDSVLFFCGIYLIYQNNFQTSLEILKKLHDPKSSKASINLENKTITTNGNFIQASRLNEILLNLYTMNSSRAYTENRKSEAYNALKECENIFGRHPQSFKHAISLALIAYEQNNNIEEAIYYTNLAKSIRPDSTAILINLGFFALIDNNIDELAKNYKQFLYTYKHDNYNFIHTIHFLEREKKKHKELSLLFEFCISTLNFLYGDKKLGKSTLLKLKSSKLNNDVSYSSIINIIEQLLIKGPYKSAYYRKNKTKNKKRKKKSKSRK